LIATQDEIPFSGCGNKIPLQARYGASIPYNEAMRRLSAKLAPRHFLLTWLSLLFLCSSVAARGQSQNPIPIPAPPNQPSGRVPPFGQGQQDTTDPNMRHAQDEAAKQRNLDRQNRLVADTDKLLQLAQELKDDVDKTNKDPLPVTVAKKAEEIEKLAKSVKDRMKAE
jgi:hypothetical protein